MKNAARILLAASLSLAGAANALAASDTCAKVRKVATSAVADDFASESAGAFPEQRPGQDHRRCKTILAGVADRDDCVILMGKAPFTWTVSWELAAGSDARAEGKKTVDELLACLPGSSLKESSVPGHWTLRWPVAGGVARLKIDSRVKDPQIDLWIRKD